MVIQDMVKMYGRKEVMSLGCFMKIDLQLAYDTVNWQFLEEMLTQLKFTNHFVKLVMTCVSTPMFSLLLNGSMTGYFKTVFRGLRQGDPMSPLSFVVCIPLQDFTQNKHLGSILLSSEV